MSSKNTSNISKIRDIMDGLFSVGFFVFMASVGPFFIMYLLHIIDILMYGGVNTLDLLNTVVAYSVLGVFIGCCITLTAVFMFMIEISMMSHQKQ